MDTNMRNLPCQRIQVDEIWQFVGAKAKNVKPYHFEDGGYAGDVWTGLPSTPTRRPPSKLASQIMRGA